MRHTLTKGFTLVELAVVVVIAGILIPLIFGPLDDLYTSYTQGTKSIIQTADVHRALRTLKNDSAYAVTFNPTLAASSPLGANDDSTPWDWRGTGADNRVLILTSYATTANKSQDGTGSRTLAFASNCSTPLTNSLIYFVKNNTLYRRTITSPSPTCISTPIFQKTSCQPGTVHASCQASDAIILSNVTKFSINYYLNSSSPDPIVDEYAADSYAPSTAQTIVVTVTTSTGNGKYLTEATRTLRVTRINGVTT